MSEPRAFDPARYLTLVSGKEYLEAKWRLVWLRSEYPNSRIETELLSHENGMAVFKATVTRIGEDGEVLGMATGHAADDAQGFAAYLEKCETAAISRALSAMGYGTQFSHDFSDADRIADSPVPYRPVGNQGSGGYQQGGGSGSDMGATDRQHGLIKSIARTLQLSLNALNDIAQEVTGSPLEGLSRRNASTLIEALKAREGGSSA